MDGTNQQMSKSQKTGGFRKVLVVFWILIALPIVTSAFFVIAAATGLFGELPGFEELENPSNALASEVYSSDGVLLGKYYIQNRTNIHYKDLNKGTIDALKATEDIRFDEHSGIDLKGLMRVFFKTVILRQSGSGGGSTITQQLAKNLFPREKISGFRIVIRKIQEWVIAARLERSYTKEEILAMYLNTVDFGSNSFGIKAASKTFFNKEPSQLRLDESAVLIGLLKAPTYYSPVRNPENSKTRRNTVFAQMLKYGLITEEQFDSLKVIPIILRYKPEDHSEGMAPYFREYMRTYLVNWCKEHKKPDGTPFNIYKDGLKIYTTIDSRMQRYAEEAMQEHMSSLQSTFFDHWRSSSPYTKYPDVVTRGVKRSERYASLKELGMSEEEIMADFNKKIPMTVFTWTGEKDTLMSPLDSLKYYKMFLRTGFMSMDPHTGHIKAWVGGINHKHFKYDQVRGGKRQVGSTFKPIVYALAMQEGYSPCFKIPNIRVVFKLKDGGQWSPSNSDKSTGGMLSLKQALAGSVNNVTAYLMKQFGVDATIALARRLGITSPIQNSPTICLGTPDITVYEMVGAYAAFANKGVWTEPIFISRIEDQGGAVLHEFIPKRVEALDEATAYITLNLMKGVVEFGTGARLRWRYGLKNDIAGKTGTTQNQSDGWFMGITPDLVSGAWVGCEDRAVRFRSTYLGQGANTALPIWGLYMQKVYADSSLGVSAEKFYIPEDKAIAVELDCSRYNSEDPESVTENQYGF
ncbi:MAG: penicillin-binding protein 1A [Bacteroidota bacterium]|jgi:penicillin-binding protein 1A